MRRGIAVLGSTGTIGTYTLQIVESNPDAFFVVSLAAGTRVSLLKEQIKKFQPKVVSVSSAKDAEELKKEFPQLEVGFSDEGIKNCIEQKDVDVVINGIVGFAALVPTMLALKADKFIGLANKESLVVAGPLFKKFVMQSKSTVIPVDSEHNALFQLLKNQERTDVETLVLTASGGPFLKKPELDLNSITPQMAIKHPNWNMGPKISVDSATLMNKGLELIEAHYLFDFPEDKIEVWVHPQSIVHGAIWFSDNTSIAQLSRPDMKSAIGYAMSYPKRINNVIKKLTLKEMANLEFMQPDTDRFRCLSLAREALKSGHSHLVVLNAANEIAVSAFLEEKIRFSEIPVVIENCLEAHKSVSLQTIDDILAMDKEARLIAHDQLGLIANKAMLFSSKTIDTNTNHPRS